MRKRANLLKSNRGRTNSTSLNDLVTQSQHTMSSQASIYTNNSKNSHRTNRQNSQSSAYSQDFDDYEDIIADDIDTLFITPEEEKKIQNILQFARKGKINPGNAFEIPVRVIDPQLTESSNMRFWKFASELLFASMSIYDKRVENMFQTTNRMFDNLIRVQGKPNQPLTQEEVEDRHRRQRGELIQMDVEDVGKVQTLSSYEIGTVNCEEAERINIKNLHNQFLPDPLFHKKLQAFDSNTLKSLFMNVFETGKDLQVTFFNEEQKQTQYIKMEIEQPKIQEKIQQDIDELEQRFPRSISSEFDKFSFNLGASPIFTDMSSFRKQNIRGPIQSNKYEVEDFTQQLKLLQKQRSGEQNPPFFINNNNESELTQTNSIHSFQGNQQFNFQFNASENTQLSQDNRHDSQTNANTFAYSARQLTLSQFYNDDGDQNYTSMTPWELEFKGMKLQKKNRKRTENNQRQRRGPKIPASDQLQINFLDGKPQIRAKMFGPTKQKLPTVRSDYIDNNLLPLSMNPFNEALKRKRLLQRADSFYNNNHRHAQMSQNEHNQAFVQHGDEGRQDHENEGPELENIINLDANYQEDTLTQRATTNFESNLIHHQHESQGVTFRSTGIRNIRQIKQKIYRNILQGRTVRLSQLNINVSPSSILIIFLHLVNEKNINITSIDDEHDLEISPKLQ